MAFRIKNLDHFAHAVNNLDEAITFWTENFGTKVKSQAVLEAVGLKNTMIDVGNTQIELIEPLEGETVVRGWLERNGQGVYLVTFEVEDLLEGVKTLREKGWRIIEAWGPLEETMACFIHPKNAMGVYIQMFERTPGGVVSH
jgi:methylmalonyl-CoA epimerase